MKINMKSISTGARHCMRVTGRFLNKHKRAIAAVTSATLTVGGTVWACKKTLDIAPKIKALHEERETLTDKKDIRKNVKAEVATYAKAYAGPAACIVGGQAAHMFVEHSMAVENASLAAGVGALQAQVKQLTKEHPVEEHTEDNDIPEYAVKDASIIGLSPYAVLFDENHPLWAQSPVWRYRELHAAQVSANALMERRAAQKNPKPLWMNDIYEMLSFQDTKLGSLGGYFLDKVNHPEADNHVDFLFYDAETKQLITDFTNGIDRPVWIDFNVDYGNVADFLPKN